MQALTDATLNDFIGAIVLCVVFVTGYLIGMRNERRYGSRRTQKMLDRYSEDYRA